MAGQITAINADYSDNFNDVFFIKIYKKYKNTGKQFTILMSLVFPRYLIAGEAVLSDAALYKQGIYEYENNNFYKAGILLFAFRQRDPSILKQNKKHLEEIGDLLRFCETYIDAKLNPVAGVTFAIRKPKIPGFKIESSKFDICEIYDLDHTVTCKDFYHKRKNKTIEYLTQCGYHQINQYKTVLRINSDSEWADFLSPCR